MSKSSISGILLVVGIFFTLFTFLLSQINVTNPYTGIETSVFNNILDWLNPLW